ncbi:hypothetical protein QFC19_005808 [Naganishia cerealis]|uniref:Uncharacterized protein n=1 Tax=Naganishia cerealis TaxID=610337 RepID=A0ACC2VMH7_9TREE|nr:hypothetical protein QFC19_005808 [Naganishia cerealis]
MAQAFAGTTAGYNTDHLDASTKTMLAHLGATGTHTFQSFTSPIFTPSQASLHSKKGRSDLSITVPNNIAKNVVASPDTVNTPFSVGDDPDITVESRKTAHEIPSPPYVAQRMMEQLPVVSNQVENVVAKRLTDPADPPEAQPAAKKKKSHARKQPVGHIPRPRNAFILFRKHITVITGTYRQICLEGELTFGSQDNDLIPKSVEVKHQNISIVASKMWAEAPPAVKAQFTEAARKEKAEHARLYPDYRYQPAYRRTDIIRRRVRKDPLEDDKCEAVASLLIQGKAGNALETEVKEKIAEKTGQPMSPTQIKLVVKKGRRKRKDAPGELSKGAIRAQKAAERARAMREHWMDTSMLLAQQSQGHLLRRAPPVNYRHDAHPKDVIYVDEYGRPVYIDDGYDLPYVDGPEDDLLPANPYAMGLNPNVQTHYGSRNMMPPMGPYQSHGLHGHRGTEQHLGRELAYMYEMNSMPEPNPAYAHQIPEYAQPHQPQENVQHWGMQGTDLQPFDSQGEHIVQTHLHPPEQMAPTARQHPANYALDPMLIPSEHTPIKGMYDYNQYTQDEPNIPAMEEYHNVSMPSDIIAGRWARDRHNIDNPGPESDEHMQGENAGPLLPLMEDEHLPSQHIDFGDKGELFGGDLNEVLPLDPDIEDYNAAFQQQQDMDGFTGQL